MKSKTVLELLLCLLAIILISNVSIASASHLQVYAYASAISKPLPNTVIHLVICPKSNTNKLVYSNSGETNTGYYTFEIPPQYTGSIYRIAVIAIGNYKTKTIGGLYGGLFRTKVNVAMK